MMILLYAFVNIRIAIFKRDKTIPPLSIALQNLKQKPFADYLVIAGGAGGASSRGGGGGAGAYRLETSQSLTATGYSVTVGAGGAGGQPAQNNGNNS